MVSDVIKLHFKYTNVFKYFPSLPVGNLTRVGGRGIVSFHINATVAGTNRCSGEVIDNFSNKYMVN